jgi:hypothetical protein
VELFLTDIKTFWERWEELDGIKRPQHVPRNYEVDRDADRESLGDVGVTELKFNKEGDVWGLVRFIYLMNPISLEQYTAILRESTGANMCLEEIRDQIDVMRERFPDAIPKVKLSGTTWKSKKFGILPRPRFQVVTWGYDPSIAALQGPNGGSPPPAQIEDHSGTLPPKPAKRDPDDDIPF